MELSWQADFFNYQLLKQQKPLRPSWFSHQRRICLRCPSVFAFSPYKLNSCIAVIWRITRNTTKAAVFPEMALGPAGMQQMGRSLCESLHLTSKLFPKCPIKSRNAESKGPFTWAAFPMLAAETISKSITDTWWHEEELHIPVPDVQDACTHHCPCAHSGLFQLPRMTNQSTGDRTGGSFFACFCF